MPEKETIVYIWLRDRYKGQVEQIFTPDNIRRLLLFLPPFILSLSFHEYAHSWAANKLGDPTSKNLGRHTLDPMVHITPFGTIIFPSIGLLMGGFLFGWAKPVPVDSRNFKEPMKHMAYVAAAGPISNVILAFLCCALLAMVRSYVVSGAGAVSPVIAAGHEMLELAVTLNLFLAFFNLIPVPPLDGSRIIQGFVPYSTARKIDEWGETGQWILLIMIFTGVLKYLAIPVYISRNILFSIFGLI